MIRRVYPLGCVLVVCGVMAVEFAVFGSPEGFGVMTPPLVAAYTVANREDRRRALWGLAAILVLGVAWMGFDPLVSRPVAYAQSSAWLSPWVIGWLLGAYLRARRLYVQGLGQPGTGLLGMRERVDVYGGDLAAGPAKGGGYELRAALPLAAR